MTSRIVPSDSYVRFLVPPVKEPAPDYIKNALPEYRITHLLGSGGFADVYEGSDPDGLGVAIKVPQFKMGKTIDSSVLEKFAFEAEIWKKLDHENIVNLYASSPRPVPHIVMEIMEGGDLEGLMKIHRLTIEEATHIMLQVLEGMSYAHRMASVHRDLKPENILFTEDGKAKITDWGIGKYMASEGITKTIDTKGTLAYSAPEQFDSRKYGKVDWQTDIFQLGIVFYEMLTGKKPFEGRDMAEVMGKVLTYVPEPPSSFNTDVPPELDEIVMGALEKDKKKRWDSGAVLLHELKSVVEGKEQVRRGERKEVGVKGQSESVLGELEEHFKLLREIGVDTSGLGREMKPIKKYARLRWYAKVIEQGNVLLEELKKRYKKELERLYAEREALMKKVRGLFEECLTRELDIEHLYDMNDEAMEAYEKGNYEKAEGLFLELQNDQERLIDEDNRRKTIWEEFYRLEKNRFLVLPPLDLERLIVDNIYLAEEKLEQWRSAIKKAGIAKKKRGERKKYLQKLGLEVERLKVKAVAYNIDVSRENGLIQSAFTLIQQEELDIAKEKYIDVRTSLQDAIQRYEAAREAERKMGESTRQKELLSRQAIWNNSKTIITVETGHYTKRLFGAKKGTKKRISNSYEGRTNFIQMRFVKIPNRNYYMARYSVTQAQWEAVMSTMPWRGKPHVKEGNLYPAIYISWYECQEFVKKLNEMVGMNKYRLPNEKEWEHACRARSTTKYCYGDGKEKLGKYAWYDENAYKIGENNPQRIGQKQPNAWGLYDMHGNVWEWCADKWDDSGLFSVLRGGGWGYGASKCCSESRRYGAISSGSDSIGFRLVREA